MAGTVRARPIYVYQYGRGAFTAVGTPAAANQPHVGDNSDSTYIKIIPGSIEKPDYYGYSTKWTVRGVQVPGGAKIKWMRAGGRARTSNTSGEVALRLAAQNISADAPYGVNYNAKGGNIIVNGTFKDIYNTVTDTSTISNGKVTNGGQIPVELVAQNFKFAVEAYDIVSDDIQISELWIDFAYDEKPIITIDPVGDVTNTTSPNFTWDYTGDNSQAYIDVEIYNGSTLVFKADKVEATEGYYSLPVSLGNGTYVYKMRAYQKWTYAGGPTAGPVSDWQQITFTVTLPQPAIPTLVGYEEDSLARTRLVATHGLNLFSQGASEGDPASWADLVNATTWAGNVYETGDRSLLVVLNGNGTDASVRVTELIPVIAAKNYGFRFRSRPYPGDPNSPIKAAFRWFDATGAVISTVFGITYTETAGAWTTVMFTAQAPANAAYVKPFAVYYSNTTADAWHYMDSMTLNVIDTLASTIAPWSRGGFAYNSINMITYGDSTLEGTSHWDAVETTTSASVVKIEDETGDDMLRYQGDYALKISTLGNLARRDIETAVAATGTTVTVNRGDVLEGDTLIAIITINSTTPTITAPSGWTLVATQDVSTTVRSSLYSKIAGASEPSTYVWTLSATAKYAGYVFSADGYNGVFANTKTTVNASTTVFNMPASTTPHNGYVIEAVAGVRGASTTATTWTSNITGANYDAQLSTTANTANEIAFGAFSKKYDTAVTTATAVTGNTLTSSAALSQAVLWTVVLQPTLTTARATLANYEYYSVDSTKKYYMFANVLGASSASMNSANRKMTFIMDFYDNNKVFISAYLVATTNATPGVWKAMSGAMPALNNLAIKYASVRLEVDQTSDGEAYYFDAMSVYQSDTNLGYIEGYKQVQGPFTVLQYSEDGGIRWEDKETIEVTSANSLPTVTFLDYEIASDTPRIYRAYNYKIEDGNVLMSGYSNQITLDIILRQIWMHIADDPSTLQQFFFDGTGREDDYDKNANILNFVGREYGQAHFDETSSRRINGNIQLPDKAIYKKLRDLNTIKELIIFRDGRGRRVKGLLKVTFSDTKWGYTASFTVDVLGIQPW